MYPGRIIDLNVTNKCKGGKSQYEPIPYCGNILFEHGDVIEIEVCQKRVFNLNPDS